MNDKQKLDNVIQFLKDYQKEVKRCSENDWEFDAGGNGVNACEVNMALRDILDNVNKILKGKKPYIFHHEESEEE